MSSLASASFLIAGCASMEESRRESAAVAPARPGPAAATAARDEPQWGEGNGKSYVVPAIDIVGFEFLLNQFDRHIYDDDGEFDSDLDSIEENLHRGWVVDRDPFAVNQIGHPYQGSMYHGFARSAGLNFWQALVYDFLGSALWEIAGETSPPSFNDQITTTVGGGFLGEALFRMASAVLESAHGEPGGWRELGAAVVSPATGFNRVAFANRFDGVFPSRDPARYSQVSVGVRDYTSITDRNVLDDLETGEAITRFAMDYGLPGESGYEYSRPFDYFRFETTLTSSSNTILENVLVRGLLYGTDYEWGDSYRGIWGLYGNYDYIAPELFSVSSSALSVGSTAQCWISDSVALQGTALGGVGWTAIGTFADASTDRDYHRGWGPQAQLELRLVLGERVLLEVGGRDYYVEGSSSDDGSDFENVLRGNAALTVRIWDHHALTVQFVSSSRDANFAELSDTLDRVGALSLMYTYVCDQELGAVDWPAR